MQAPSTPLPAHETKSHSLLHYPVLPTSLVLTLAQDDAAEDTTGTTLWLGAQLLSLYVTGLYSRPKSLPAAQGRPRAIELGAGVGLTSLVLAALGFDVVTTDLPVVVDAVLQGNARRNVETVREWGVREGRETGGVVVGALDWLKSGELRLGEEKGGGEGDVGVGPFDLIVTSDTIYHPSLITPLLQTLRALSRASKRRKRFPTILLGVEKRDERVVGSALEEARGMGFECGVVRTAKVERAMVAAGVKWEKKEWEEVEIWKWRWREMDGRESKLR